MKNAFVFTLEYSDNGSVRGNYDAGGIGGTNCLSTGRSGSLAPSYCTQYPDGAPVYGLNSMVNRQISQNPWSNDWRVKTWSGGVMDTVDFTERFSGFAGIRFGPLRL